MRLVWFKRDLRLHDPLVAHQAAVAQARARIATVRGQHPQESRRVLQRHGSRKGWRAPVQGTLFEEVDDWDGAAL